LSQPFAAAKITTHEKSECTAVTEADLKDRQKGFSLLELLVVVAIILIIAAIALPNLMRSRMAANESSAVNSLRTLNSATILYSTTYGGYPSLLSKFGPASPATSTSADLIDSVLSGGIKSGYSFTWSAAAPDASGIINSYSITSQPTVPGTTGLRYFYTDTSGVIRANPSGVASISSTPIG
jgi:prepilin-type N-terminal cleavage/methylation domain-containing protein